MEKNMERVAGYHRCWFSLIAFPVVACWSVSSAVPLASANEQGHLEHVAEDTRERAGAGYPIPGASFRVFMDTEGSTAGLERLDRTEADAVVQTVIGAFTLMLQRRSDYPRFDEALKKDVLHKVLIEPKVVNRDGKEFPFLVARTVNQGRVNLLISAASIKANGYLGRPEQLVPALAREFQWVVSKADTTPRAKAAAIERDLERVPIHSDKEILELSGDERARLMQRLFDTYLTTVDDRNSLEGQPYYEVGTPTLDPPSQPDSTTKLYDIRAREALQKIVREPYFLEHTPKAVRSLLNGKVWNVAFVKIDQRDWATRTRVLPADKAVVVGKPGQTIQPATILVNTYRTASSDDPFYRETKGLPMGALSADQLALVIATEIEQNIIEKSMRGHVAQDAISAPE